MNFRKAERFEAQRCLDMVNAICDYEAEFGKQTCWERDRYPTMVNLQQSFENDNDLYVLEDEIDGKNTIVACGRINYIQPDFYKTITWQYDVPSDQVLVLHIFAVDPVYQKRGYGRTFMSHYEQLAREKGCSVLRLDTVIENQKSQGLYKNLGFKIMGQWTGDPNGVDWTLTLIGLEKKL